MEIKEISDKINIAKFLGCEVYGSFINSIITDFTVKGEVVKELRNINNQIGGFENKCLLSNFKFESDWNSLIFLLRKIKQYYKDVLIQNEDVNINDSVTLINLSLLSNIEILDVYKYCCEYINKISNE